MHLTVYCLRAERFNLTDPASAARPSGAPCSWPARTNVASYVLPAKTGDASLVVYLRTHVRRALAMGLATLLVSRLLDGATLCCGLSAACLWLAPHRPLSGRSRGFGSASRGPCSGCAGLLSVLSVRGDLHVRWIAAGLRFIRLAPPALAATGCCARPTSSRWPSARPSGHGRLLARGPHLGGAVDPGLRLLRRARPRPWGLPEHCTFAEATFGSSLDRDVQPAAGQTAWPAWAPRSFGWVDGASVQPSSGGT
jgi:hypothetical protein